MAGNFKKPSKKTAIIAIVAVIILLAIAITGTVVFLRDRGTTEAADLATEQVDRQESTDEQTSTAGQTTEGTQPEDTSTQATEQTDTQTGETVAQADETTGTTTETNRTTTGTTGGTGTTANTGTRTDNIQESTITEYETTVTEDPWRTEDNTWTPIAVNADLASAKINPTKDDIEVIKEGNETVAQGETINYTITVKNNTDKKLEGIEVKDVLDSEKLDLSTVEYKNGLEGTLTENTIKWHIDIEAHSEVKVEFSVKVKTNVTPDTTIENQAIANGEESEKVITEVEEAKTTLPVSKEINAGDSDAAKAYPITGVVVT